LRIKSFRESFRKNSGLFSPFDRYALRTLHPQPRRAVPMMDRRTDGR